MTKKIPHSKPNISQEDITAISNQVASGMHATGSKTQEFEEKMLELTGVKYAKATTSGTTALHLALLALDIKENDEVIIPSYACQSLLNSINYTGAKPVLVDIDDSEKSYNLSAKTITPLITEKTKAIIVPHMFGIPADLDEIIELGIPVIEDCAQALGAEYKGKKLGSMGDIGVFSFYATKVISTGQGGMLVTNSEKINDRITDLTTYDQSQEYKLAYNYGLSDIQSALGISQLKRLPEFIERRNEIAEKYNNAFKNTKLKLLLQKEDSFHFRYILGLPNSDERDNLQSYLLEKNIIPEKPVFKPLHQYLNLAPDNFPNTELAHNTLLSIPIYPALTDEEVDYIIKSVRNFL